jgi:hypothetical protein
MISPILTITKGAWESMTLDAKNKALQDSINIPFINNLKGVARYQAILSLIDANLERGLKKAENDTAKYELLKNTRKLLKRELNMSKNDLLKEPANKYEVEELACAIKRMSLYYDEGINKVMNQTKEQADIYTDKLLSQVIHNQDMHAVKLRQSFDDELNIIIAKTKEQAEKAVNNLINKTKIYCYIMIISSSLSLVSVILFITHIIGSK